MPDRSDRPLDTALDAARVIARQLVDRVPPARRQQALEGARRLLAPPAAAPSAAPPGRTIATPADVADEAATRAFLTDTDLFGPNTAEAAAYLDDAFERFRVTLALVPDLPAGAKVLELGSNPYFMTRLLMRRGLHVTSANWFGEGVFGSTGSQLVRSPAAGTEHEFVFDHFNVEQERFPYDDDSFDLVLFCEILEHLPADPIHTLGEIHRVLRPGATMLLTTPNAIRWENTVRMQRGQNVYEQLSGYGTYGRHNREYTVGELRDLLTDNGFVVDDVFAHDIHPGADWGTPLPGTDLTDRGDNLFALARAEGERRWRYPDWLYLSKHGLAKVVLPLEVTAGVNSDLQGGGLHHLETIAGRSACWMAGDTHFFVRPPTGRWRMVFEGRNPPPESSGPVTLSVAADGVAVAEWSLAPDGQPFTVEAVLDADTEATRRLTVTADRTWSPSDTNPAGDGRRLSAVFHRLRLEPA